MVDIYNLEKLKILRAGDLQDRDVFVHIRDTARYFIQFGRSGDAKDMRVVLDRVFKQAYSKLSVPQREAYDEIIVRLAIFTLITLSDEELKDLLQKHIVYALRLGLPVLEQFREYIDYYHDYYSDFRQSQSFKALLQNNDEKIWNLRASQWLIMYQTEAGQQLPRGGLQRMHFFNQNSEVKNLSTEERGALLALLEFFDWLSYPTPAEQEYAEEVASETQFDNALLVALKQGLPSSLQSIDLKSALHDIYSSLIQKKDPNIKELTTQPLSVRGLKIFLHTWFIELLGLKETDALRIVLKLINSLKAAGFPQYIDVLYFDPQDKTLHWK